MVGFLGLDLFFGWKEQQLQNSPMANTSPKLFLHNAINYPCVSEAEYFLFLLEEMKALRLRMDFSSALTPHGWMYHSLSHYFKAEMTVPWVPCEGVCYLGLLHTPSLYSSLNPDVKIFVTEQVDLYQEKHFWDAFRQLKLYGLDESWLMSCVL